MQKAKFIISKQKVLEQYDKLKELGDIISYSSKTNPLISQILEKETDCMFSIHLKNELKHVKDKSRIFFLAQAWNQEDIKELINFGIRNFVVDNESDLGEIVKFLEKNQTKINLLLRIKLKENTIRTEKYFVFGMDSDLVNKKIKELRQNKNIERLGIHFHRKTQNMSEWNLEYEILEIIDKDILDMIDIINIGGGLPSDYANTNVNVLPGILNKIKEFKKWTNEKNIKIIIEPGRFIAAPAGKLVTQIVGIYENNIIVNCSVYNTDMDALIVPVKLLVEGESNNENGSSYVIKGMTPCSMDLFRYRVYLKNPEIGQKIVFLNAGAYNFSTDFCDLNKLDTEIIEKFD